MASNALRDTITRALTQVLGRMPIGWLQLTHSRMRMIVAVAGVVFANILVFVQLGILGALNGTIEQSYELLRADIIIASDDAHTLADGSPVARRYLYQALSVPGVAAASPHYLGKLDWARPDRSSATLYVYGLPVDVSDFAGPMIAPHLPRLSLADRALIDRHMRGGDRDAFGAIRAEDPMLIEARGHQLTLVGSFALGGGFTADGALFVSDQTFLRLFPQRLAGTPSQILIKVEEGYSPAQVVADLQRVLDAEPVQVKTWSQFIRADRSYQTTQRPVGIVFGFGVFIGVLVGIVIVYQVLSTDVADHIKEYATFKAMGYPQGFFLSVVFEEAMILAVLGFIPGSIIATLIYKGLSSVSGLPVAMDAGRIGLVFIGTLVACSISGAIATRRLTAADPAELF
ncbi:ABC transporter permease DevC [Woodsholea maritima]|uniref:ABC transporter permease DevC n=1 Tax=Woodsholea maritima TaxID=240237 RepID=UPI000360C69E|nr:ABC transporter permease DevC [Woodsholea maritima]